MSYVDRRAGDDRECDSSRETGDRATCPASAASRIRERAHHPEWEAAVSSGALRLLDYETTANLRGQGIGAAMMSHAIERARARGCQMIQLSTNKQRADAKRFYERLGFEATHEGMKLSLHD